MVRPLCVMLPHSGGGGDRGKQCCLLPFPYLGMFLLFEICYLILVCF